MRVALFFPLNWCTTLCSSSEWENIVSPLTEGLVKHGIDVVPFAADGLNAWRMSWKRDSAVLGGKSSTPTKLSERLPVSEVFEQGDPFDILHIYLDCVPLACLRTNGTPVVVTMPRFFSPDSLSDYKHFNTQAHYVAVSEAGKSCELDYVATIHPGVDLQRFHFQAGQGKYLLFMESLTEAKGAAPCIDVARETDCRSFLSAMMRTGNTLTAAYGRISTGTAFFISSVRNRGCGKTFSEARMH